MPAVKAANPRLIFAPNDWAAITRVSRYRGLWLIIHAWIVAAVAAWAGAVAWHLHWAIGLLATPIVLAVLGGRQLGLSILMHEAAHGLLHPNRRTNNFLGQWLTGAATGSDLYAYRTYHLAHHKFTQQDEDPDLELSRPFPASRDSLRRKIIRDLTGQTFFKQRRAQFGAALVALHAKVNDGSAARTVMRFLMLQVTVLIISLLTVGWIAFALWIGALATTFQLFLRIRNIAEHACTTTGSNDPFSHARTTYANLIERATVAPYWVNFHSEHHLFMGVPCYNLPRAHVLLGQSGHHPHMTIEPSYRAVMRAVIA